jgi:hypothetical protein
MGMTLCAEIPDEVFNTIKGLGSPKMVLAKESPAFPKKGARIPGNYPGSWLSP